MLNQNHSPAPAGNQKRLVSAAELRDELFGESQADPIPSAGDDWPDWQEDDQDRPNFQPSTLATSVIETLSPPDAACLLLASSEESASGEDSSITIEDEETVLADLQRRYYLLDLGGSLYIGTYEQLLERNTMGGLAPLTVSKLAFGQLKMRRYIRSRYSGIDAKALAAEFITHPGSHCYMSTTFDPRCQNANSLNLYAPPAIEPMEGDCREVERFLQEVICNEDQEAYNYLFGYLAHAYQYPWEKPGVMTILVGGQGIGKGTYCEILRQIWRPTYIQVNDMREVVGNFNTCLERTLWVVMDEALFAGCRRETDRLKSLITEPEIMISAKYLPSRSVMSHLRFVMTTNAAYAKFTESDDRRDFVLRVSERYRGDHDYWSQLRSQLNPSSLAAFVHKLAVADLSNFNVRAVPTTAEKTQQKIYSLGPTESLWFQCLKDGALPEHETWSNFIRTETLLEEVIAHAGRTHKKPISRDVVSAMTKMCPSVHNIQKRVGSDRGRGLQLPTLDVARAEFETWIGGTITW